MTPPSLRHHLPPPSPPLPSLPSPRPHATVHMGATLLSPEECSLPRPLHTTSGPPMEKRRKMKKKKEREREIRTSMESKHLPNAPPAALPPPRSSPSRPTPTAAGTDASPPASGTLRCRRAGVETRGVPGKLDALDLKETHRCRDGSSHDVAVPLYPTPTPTPLFMASLLMCPICHLSHQ